MSRVLRGGESGPVGNIEALYPLQDRPLRRIVIGAALTLGRHHVPSRTVAIVIPVEIRVAIWLIEFVAPHMTAVTDRPLARIDRLTGNSERHLPFCPEA